MKYAIVTASIKHNGIKNPTIYHPNADYYCFTDNLLESGIWKNGDIYNFSLDGIWGPRINAKIYKVLTFLMVPNYEYYFWVDSTNIVEMNPEEIVDKYLKNSDIAVFKHPDRNCLYEEARIVRQFGIDYYEKIDRQVSYYKHMNYPEQNGLYELTAFAYRNTFNSRSFMLKWWEHITRFSSRDQISFPYICKEMNIVPTIMPGEVKRLNKNNVMPAIR